MMNNSIKTNNRIVYFGKAVDSITAPIIDSILVSNSTLAENRILKRRVPFLIAESFQNVIRHKANIDELSRNDKKSDFFQVINNKNGMTIESSNLILSKEEDKLVSHINSLNSSSKEQLKKMKMDRLKNTDLSTKGGAGLGLIEIARKTDSSISYRVTHLDNGYSHFFMSISILSIVLDSKIEMDRLVSDFHSLKEKGIVAQFEGEFTEEMDHIMTNVFQKNLIIKGYNNTFVPTLNLSEVLKNINNLNPSSNDAESVNSEIIFYKKNNNFRFSYKTELHNSQSSFIQNNLESIKSKIPEQIESEYQKLLLKKNLNKSEKVIFGFYELALFSKNSFQLSLDQTSEKTFINIDFEIS